MAESVPQKRAAADPQEVPDSNPAETRVSALSGPGLLIASIAPDADAGRAGAAAGDLVVQIGDTPIATPAGYQREIDKLRGEGQVFAMVLLLKKTGAGPDAKPSEPKWLALRVAH